MPLSIFLISLRHVQLWRILLEIVLAGVSIGYLAYRVLRQLKPKQTKKFYFGDTRHSTFKFLDQKEWQQELQRLEVSTSSHKGASLPVDGAIGEILDLVVAIFIDSWYKNISDHEAFQASLRNELWHIIEAFKSHLAKTDIAELVFIKILPMINLHFKDFSTESVPLLCNYQLESKLKVVRSSGKTLHEGVSLSTNKSNFESEKAYLRKITAKLLPQVLTEGERQNKVVSSILREILASTVLFNVVEMLAEGDFVNQMIVKFMGDSLQRRSQVKRLRAALEQHTRQADERQDTASPLPSVSGKFTEARYQHCLAFIDNATEADLVELRDRLTHSISQHSDTHSQEYQSMLELVQQISNKLEKPKLSLDEALNNNDVRSSFARYLEKNEKLHVLGVFEAINELRSPLCALDVENPDSLEFANSDNIRSIFDNFLIHSETLESSIPAIRSVYRGINDETTITSAKSELISVWLKVNSELASVLYPSFLQSVDNGTAPYSVDTHASAEQSILTTENSQLDADVTEASISPAVIDAVEKSLEQIINTKAQTPGSSGTSRNESTLTLKNLVSPMSSSSRSNSPTLKDRLPPGTSAMSQSGIFESLDKSESESELSDSFVNSDSEESKLGGSEILRAAPGDLSLAEKLASISQDIKNLREQNEILLPLLKKAELTNNVSEITILKRSKQGLEREIASKELQRQHWIIQENENSLFGKSRIQISSYMTETKNGSDYVLYIVEVQKFSNDDPNEVTAGWVVARRFSQFYQLNEYLKKKSSKVSHIKFPKKAVLNFQKKQLLELRKKGLEQYLQQLLTIPEVCSDPILRSFLSSENFSFSSLKKPKKNLDDILGSLSLSFSDHDNSKYPEVEMSTTTEFMESIKEMQSELKQFDESQRYTSGKVPFVKPISDFLIDVFDLGSSKSWIRGRALLILLQQVLGSAIEKKIRSSMKNILNDEAMILTVIGNLKDTVFPNGRFKDPPIVRSEALQEKTRSEARAIFEVYMEETCGKVFGNGNTKVRSRVLFELFQNDFINKSLIFQLLDQLVKELFP
ncbi:uncharacterized protein CXQ87_000214 [Candidozyma duobushaemuli]|nr:uncharacterized protein CXQ87_000214 [[Candida] duobushaemulonis]PVH17330.1 hypothetical protein CXQ87_000214 [[Candida] duobushaemulonis]